MSLGQALAFVCLRFALVDDPTGYELRSPRVNACAAEGVLWVGCALGPSRDGVLRFGLAMAHPACTRSNNNRSIPPACNNNRFPPHVPQFELIQREGEIPEPLAQVPRCCPGAGAAGAGLLPHLLACASARARPLLSLPVRVMRRSVDQLQPTAGTRAALPCPAIGGGSAPLAAALRIGVPTPAQACLLQPRLTVQQCLSCRR